VASAAARAPLGPFRAGEPEDGVVVGQQFGDDRGADGASATGYEDPHMFLQK